MLEFPFRPGSASKHYLLLSVYGLCHQCPTERVLTMITIMQLFILLTFISVLLYQRLNIRLVCKSYSLVFVFCAFLNFLTQFHFAALLDLLSRHGLSEVCYFQAYFLL